MVRSVPSSQDTLRNGTVGLSAVSGLLCHPGCNEPLSLGLQRNRNFTSFADVANGAEVLYQTILILDGRLDRKPQ